MACLITGGFGAKYALWLDSSLLLALQLIPQVTLSILLQIGLILLYYLEMKSLHLVRKRLNEISVGSW